MTKRSQDYNRPREIELTPNTPAEKAAALRVLAKQKDGQQLAEMLGLSPA